MKNLHSKKAFSLIELVFVIVIIGILAAVALPKMTGMADETRKTKMEAFIGTLNRTVAPVLWVNNSSNEGSIKSVTYNDLLSSYIELPHGIENLDLSLCADSTATLAIKVADITTDALSISESLYCRDGDANVPPKFGLTPELNVTL